MSERQLARSVLSTWKTMALVGGIVALILGLILVFWPGKTLLVLGALVGIWLVILGIIRIADAVVGRHATGTSRGFSALAGAIYLIAGIIVLANLHASLKFVAIVLGLFWIFGGVSEIIAGFTRVRGAGGKTLAILMGLVDIALGIVILVWPGPTLIVLVWIAALWLIVIGLLQLWFAYQAGKAAKEIDDPAYHVVDEQF